MVLQKCTTSNKKQFIQSIHVWHIRATETQNRLNVTTTNSRDDWTQASGCASSTSQQTLLCECITALSLLTFTFTLVSHVLMTLHWLTRNDFASHSTQKQWNHIEDFFLIHLNKSSTDSWCEYNLKYVLKSSLWRKHTPTHTHTHTHTCCPAGASSMVGMCAQRTETQWRSFPVARARKYCHGCGLLYKDASLESAQLTVFLCVCVCVCHTVTSVPELCWGATGISDLTGNGIWVAFLSVRVNYLFW